MKKRGMVGSALVTLCVLYPVIVAAYLVGRTLMPSHGTSALTLLDALLPFATAPLLLTFPLALILRSRGIAAGSVLLLLLFVFTYPGLFTPRHSSAFAEEQDALKVMTFNVHYQAADPEQIVAAISAERADMVAIQELSPTTATYIRQRLEDAYPHMAIDPEGGTNALLSRHPILEAHWQGLGSYRRDLLWTILDVRGQPMHVLVFHPSRPRILWSTRHGIPIGISFAEREEQARLITRLVKDLPEPVILAGDFNMTEHTLAYDIFTQNLGDAYREAGQGFGFTFPNRRHIRGIFVPFPVIRIDYIFHSGEFQAKSAQVGCQGGSDHCYVVATLGYSR